MTLDQLLIRAESATRNAIANGVEPLPTWLAENAQGVTLPIMSPPFESEGAIERTLETIRDLFAEFGAVRYVSILPAYALEGQAAREFKGGASISDHPDRREVVAILAVDIDGSFRAGHCYVLRPEHGKPSLSPMREMPQGYRAAGKGAGLLQTREERATRH